MKINEAYLLRPFFEEGNTLRLSQAAFFMKLYFTDYNISVSSACRYIRFNMNARASEYPKEYRDTFEFFKLLMDLDILETAQYKFLNIETENTPKLFCIYDPVLNEVVQV